QPAGHRRLVATTIRARAGTGRAGTVGTNRPELYKTVRFRDAHIADWFTTMRRRRQPVSVPYAHLQRDGNVRPNVASGTSVQ
ncbi:MAG TPA: hypothetical protein VKU39_11170, partial [Streptosporangiaceae bacterium]|nr:hypothetical protein [Streptosporangiaceae bacterium]